MRVALVSPYSWSYPGGVTRHIEALAAQLRAVGHEARIITPFDPDDRLSTRLHRGARPQRRTLDDGIVPLGRTVGFPANGAVSNLTILPSALWALRAELRDGGYDVVHVHEPIAPVLGWDLLGSCRLPLVGTFHAYSTNRLTNGLGNLAGAGRLMNRLAVRIAVSQAAAWTGRRFFGGCYRVIPNGVDVPERLDRPDPRAPSEQRPLRLAFVGQAVERKGLPVALRAFEALHEHIPVTFDLVGVDQHEVEALLLEPAGVTAHGKLADAAKLELLRSADLLLAPSLGGESFGMVLTEAFAAGTPVVASDIPGYASVVTDGADGLLVPPGDASALATSVLELANDLPRRRALSQAARESASRFAWPIVAAQVLEAYDDAIHAPQPHGAVQRTRARLGLRPADPAQPRAALLGHRLPTLEPSTPFARPRLQTLGRRALVALVVLGSVLAAYFAVRQIGPGKIVSSLVTSQPSWVVFGLGLMCAAMTARGIAWHAILRAALPRARVKRSDALRGTFIGVLMSATLPARLGEPSRSLVVARRIGRPVETLPVVLGTVVSQTLLNLLALAILGAIMFTSANLFNGHHSALIAVAVAPAALVALIVLVPLLARRGAQRRDTLVARLQAMALRVRAGMRVFRQPRLAAIATSAQLTAWALQCSACYVLLMALGLDSRAGIAGAAGVLFAVNVTAVLPAAPSNIGVFQAACVAVLSGGFHVSAADAIAYGIILQAVEITTAIVMGLPALLREGMSWRDVRLRTLYAAPVRIAIPDSHPLARRSTA